jgi:hypothetical protein
MAKKLNKFLQDNKISFRYGILIADYFGLVILLQILIIKKYIEQLVVIFNFLIKQQVFL